MTGLKTLKDLEHIEMDISPEERGYIPDSCYRGELRQEAIKDIKFARSSKDGKKGIFRKGIKFMFTEDVINYIKWKFNITEEDLKEK